VKSVPQKSDRKIELARPGGLGADPHKYNGKFSTHVCYAIRSLVMLICFWDATSRHVVVLKLSLGR
jgi:hypothetical protein